MRINTKILERKPSRAQGDYICSYRNTLAQWASVFVGSPRAVAAWWAWHEAVQPPSMLWPKV